MDLLLNPFNPLSPLNPLYQTQPPYVGGGGSGAEMVVGIALVLGFVLAIILSPFVAEWMSSKRRL